MTIHRYTLTKPKLMRLLEGLKSDSVFKATLCLPPLAEQAEIRDLAATVFQGHPMTDEIVQYIAGSSTGTFIVWSVNHWYLILPPFPLAERRYSRSCELEPLYSLLHEDYLIGIILVRLGAYGIGIYRGEEFLSGKTGTGLVHSRHRKGGSSSHRFERHREKQIEIFFSRVCDHVKEQLGPYARNIDYIQYGGTQETITAFRKYCHILKDLNNRTLRRLLDIRNPGRSGLEEAIRATWSSTIIQWREG